MCALKTCAVFLSIILRKTEAGRLRSEVMSLIQLLFLCKITSNINVCWCYSKCVCAFLTNNTLTVSRKTKIIWLALFICDGYICCFETKSQTCSHLRWLMSTMLTTGIKQLSDTMILFKKCKTITLYLINKMAWNIHIHALSRCLQQCINTYHLQLYKFYMNRLIKNKNN